MNKREKKKATTHTVKPFKKLITDKKDTPTTLKQITNALSVVVVAVFILSLIVSAVMAFDNLGLGKTTSPQIEIPPIVLIEQAQPSTTPAPIAKIKNTTNTPSQITCTGPDGVQFKTTQQGCDDFNNAWKKSPEQQPQQTNNPNPQTNNGYIKCNISPNCGGGFRETTLAQCDDLVCCQVGSNWTLTSKADCGSKQESRSDEEKQAWDDYKKAKQDYANKAVELSNSITECLNLVQANYNVEVATCEKQWEGYPELIDTCKLGASQRAITANGFCI